jgi:GNAT superfamily N-acetyltransferase
MILELEEVAFNAWPSLHTVVYDGWLLNMSNGYMRRANAIHPFYPSSQPLDEKIATCERLYAAHNLPALYKMTDASLPSDLDAVLEARGYTRDGGNLIMTTPLEHPRQLSPLARVIPAVTEEWLSHYTRLNAERAQYNPILMRLFGAIALPTAYVTLERAGQVIAVGVAVAERSNVGLFGLAVDASVRRQGLGRQLVETCLAWGATQGAQRGYLQVGGQNSGAIALYERTGFREAYRYWYRTQPA